MGNPRLSGSEAAPGLRHDGPYGGAHQVAIASPDGMFPLMLRFGGVPDGDVVLTVGRPGMPNNRMLSGWCRVLMDDRYFGSR